MSPVSLWLGGSDVYVGADSFTKLVFLGNETKGSQSKDKAHQKGQQHQSVLPLTLLKGLQLHPLQPPYSSRLCCYHQLLIKRPGEIIPLYSSHPQLSVLYIVCPAQKNTFSGRAQVEVKQLFCTQARPL